MSCARCQGTGQIARYDPPEMGEAGRRLPDADCPDCGGIGMSPAEQLASMQQELHDLMERVERLEERPGSDLDEEE